MFKAIIAVIVAAAMVSPMSTLALDCPVLHATASPGVIEETAADVASDGNLLANDDTGNAIGEVIFRLRSEYPGASAAEIQDYLLTAYCPSLVQQGYDDATTAQMFSAFTASVEDQLADSQG